MQKEWQNFSSTLKDTLHLELSPVAVSLIKLTQPVDKEKKIRICRALLDAAAGGTLQVCSNNNACFGAAWHLGLRKINDPRIEQMVKKFVVEGEKLFCSYEALDNLMSQMQDTPDNSGNCFSLAPMEKAEFNPEIVIFVCNPQEACRLLTLVTFLDGNMPKIKIGGPTCRMVIIYPMVMQEVNISFYDATARKICNVSKDKLLVSIPYGKIQPIVESLDKCSAGTAKIEYPKEFREFLQKRMVK